MATQTRALSRDRGTVELAALLPLLLATVLLGGAWPVTRIAFLHGAQPAWFAVGRAGLSALAAGLFLLLARRWSRPRWRDWPVVATVGLLQIAGFFAFAHEGAALVPAGRTAVLANATTLWMPMLAWVLLRESIPPARWLGSLLGLAGVVWLAEPWRPGAAAGAPGYALLLAAALCFALAIALVRRRPPATPMVELLPWCFGLGTMVLAAYAALRAPAGGFGGDWRAWAALLAIGMVAGPVGTLCVMQASARLPAMVASVGFLGAPVVGLLLATVWLGEPVSAALLCGCALVLAGVVVAAWPGGGRGRGAGR